MNKYTIAIVTYKRPQMLRELLIKLTGIKRYDETIVLVIDNDAQKSAYNVCVEMSSKFTNIIYNCESAKGLANARNRALKESFKYSDTMLFIDDDEIPHEDWLVNMLKCKESFKASVVIGPVLTELRAKKRFITENFFKHPNPNHSFYMTNGGGSGNCLISKEVLDLIPGPAFNTLYNETGGEDLDFFNKIYKAGIKVAWAHDAYTTEIITADRINFKYAMRRKFNIQYTRDRITYHKGMFLKLLFFSVSRISIGILRVAISLGIFERIATKGLINIAKGFGTLYAILKILGFLKRNVDNFYSQTTGN